MTPSNRTGGVAQGAFELKGRGLLRAQEVGKIREFG
ncbi:hypothetical protein M2271_007590 [Streptomyces sp. LBL]|nr:hypothetical protein [Streptomyces sp. LBL]